MENAVLVHNSEEARAFIQKFQEDLATLVISRTTNGGCCGLNEQSIMRSLLLWNAGYLEGTRKGNLEILASMGRLQPGMAFLLDREMPDEIYDKYTAGFNEGLTHTDEKRAKAVATFERLYPLTTPAAAVDNAARPARDKNLSVGMPTDQQKKEEVK
jgi:hypothetical protein